MKIGLISRPVDSAGAAGHVLQHQTLVPHHQNVRVPQPHDVPQHDYTLFVSQDYTVFITSYIVIDTDRRERDAERDPNYMALIYSCSVYQLPPT